MKEYLLGDEIKLGVHIDPNEGYTLKDVDFKTEVFCSKFRVITFTKNDVIPISHTDFACIVDSTMLGEGEVKIRVTTFIPDGDAQDGFVTKQALLHPQVRVVSKYGK